jgi:CTP synthase
MKKLKLSPKDDARRLNLWSKWNQMAERAERSHDVVKIVLVGKYTDLHDSYISVVKALEHSSFACNRKLVIQWVEATDLETSAQESNPVKFHDAWKKVCTANGILVPGGFGDRGVEGKIAAIRRAREHNIPFLGICLGLQLATVEFARNVVGLEGAHSVEFNPDTPHPLVVFMPEISKTHMGGTMRLGARDTVFTPAGKDSVARKLYGDVDRVSERHRHRYEVNTKYVPQMEEKGLMFIGHDEAHERMEIIELKGMSSFFKI